MRLKLSRFRRNFNKDLPIEFTEQNLSSFGGLELFSRYLRRVELSRRVGKACRGKGIRSDYGSVRLVLVLVGMLLVGARRLEHLQYVCDDPMLLRFCGLRRLPSRPTIVNWLKQFTGERLKGLSELNGVLVHEQIERLGLNRLTVDMDGTVVQAGNQVGWAFRGFNPHRKKNKRYLFTADAGVGAGQKRPPRLSYSTCSGPGGSRFANWANGLNGLRASWVD